MKRIIIIALCLCLLLCGCAPSFSETDGSILKEFIQTFPFYSTELDSAVDWFNDHRDYTVEHTDTSTNTVEVLYKGNFAWQIAASCYTPSNLINLKGYYVTFRSDAYYSEQSAQDNFDCIVDELTELCGNPADTSDGGTVKTFYYKQLKIVVVVGQTINLTMYYENPFSFSNICSEVPKA